MANENKFFVDSDTEVLLNGVRDENGVLLTGSAVIVGKIGKAIIEFEYTGDEGNFRGIIPSTAGLKPNTPYTMLVEIQPPGSLSFVVSITRKASYIKA